MTIKSVLKRLISEEFFIERIPNTDPSTTELSVMPTRKGFPEMVHGKAAIIDGIVVVKDPENDGSYATIVVPDEPTIRVYVNGEQVYGEVVITESDVIDIGLYETKPLITYETIVSDDELNVTIEANASRGVSLSLKDCLPRRRLILSFDKTLIAPEPQTPEDIMNLLVRNGYDGTINHGAVQRLSNAVGNQREVVVSGFAPSHGREGRLRTAANFRTERDQVFRTKRCSTVSIGTTIAVLEPQIEGVPGKNVYGQIILPLSFKQAIPNLGHGVINVNGNVVAVRDGRLKYTKNTVDVTPELSFDRDVTALDGEIKFDGNVIIKGSIKDGAVLKASGTIIVYGSIQEGTVYGDNAVIVRDGIFKSTVVSGHKYLVYKGLSSLLEKIIPQLKRFKDEYSVMVDHAIKRFDARVTIPKIPALLFEHRHMDLDQMLGMFVEDYSDKLSSFDDSYRLLKETVESKWRGVNRFNLSQKDIDALIEKITLLHGEIKRLPTELSVIRAADIASSALRSTGNIIVLGSCYSSTLESDNTISIHKTLRGGFAVAKKSAYVSELGSPSGVESSVRVTQSKGFISLKLNHHNTLLEVNGRRYRSYDTERDVRFKGDVANG